MANAQFNVLVGSESGLLKGVDTESNKWENINKVDSAKKENEIQSICFDINDGTKLYVGTRSHNIFSYDFKDEFTEIYHFDDCKGNLRSIKSTGDQLLTASDNGVVRVWDCKTGEKCSEFLSGENLCFMTQNTASSHIIATGGKETDLKIWNMNDSNKCIFEAKNVKNDWLNLRVPVWVLGAQFLPMSDKIVTCTGHHQIRVYDPKVQRRPVLDMTFDEHPITAIALCPLLENYAVVGNTIGKMATIDFRTGKMINIFKGFAGSIRDIKCHDSEPVVASCGLDRYLCIHDYQTKELKQKFYLKSRLNCLSFYEPSLKTVNNNTEKETCEQVLDENNTNLNIEDEEIWNQMEVVKTKSKRKGYGVGKNSDIKKKKIKK